VVSETVPERPAPRQRKGFIGTLTAKIGPLPMWVWVVLVTVILLAWRWYASKQANTSGTTGTDTTAADQVPQFVNQTYTTVTPPAATPPPPLVIPREPPPLPNKQTLTRTWKSLGGSTYAEVAQRLLGNANVANLHPANAAAVKWVQTVYAKNHNAKMPKGLVFSYTEGTVTAKPGTPPLVK
jgi:hypothetical protein